MHCSNLHTSAGHVEVQEAQHEKNADLLRKNEIWKAGTEREIGFYLYVAEPGKAWQSIAC